MKQKYILSLLVTILLAVGCASLSQSRATIADGTIQNASLGFSGFSFKIPDGFAVYSPEATPSAEYTPLQQLAIRVYELNEEWHPRGNEFFYESFLLMSDHTCFLLITLKSDDAIRMNEALLTETVSPQWQLMPLYNVTETQVLEPSETRPAAVYTRGYAYERKGWYYADPKRNGLKFNYQACKMIGGKRDSYILMGFAQPEDAEALSEPMKSMMNGMKFQTL